MKNWISVLVLFALAGIVRPVSAQNILTKEEAVKLLLENNFGVLIQKNQQEIAKNNASIWNSGYLPELGVDGGANYNLSNLSAEFQDGRSTSLNGATSSAFNASAGLNYALFDGLGRMYNYRQLKEQYNLSELDARETIENAIAQLFSLYYEVAFLTQNTLTLEEITKVSKDRLDRVKMQFDYGQTNRLSVLNAEVDLSNDSITYVTALQNLQNAKRNLNLVLGRNTDTYFEVDTAVIFVELMEKEKLQDSYQRNNVRLQQARKNFEIGDYNLMLSRSNYLPRLNLNANYGFNKNFNNEASFLASSFSYGLNAGVGLSWNIFDGGRTKTAVQNSKVNIQNLSLLLNQTELEVQRDFLNAWDDYQNKLFVYYSQEKNVKTSRLNFERTYEQFKLGQINAVEFRQSQVNLQNALNGRDRAKYEAKYAEILLLQVGGTLLESDF